jgi:hypothetical protein
MTAHPAIHALHDLGAATWFGGTLAGATGLNAAAALLDDPAERSRVATTGWSRWAPVGAAGVLAHLVGAGGLTVTDWPRIAGQSGVARSSAVKAGLTAAGLGVHGWSIVLNRRMRAAGDAPVRGATEPAASTPSDVEATLRQLKLVQWLNPLLAGAVIGTASWQSEQQRAAQVASGVLRRLSAGVTGRAPVALPVIGALALGAVAARRRRHAADSVEAYPTPPVVQRPISSEDVVDLNATDDVVAGTGGPTAP